MADVLLVLSCFYLQNALCSFLWFWEYSEHLVAIHIFNNLLWCNGLIDLHVKGAQVRDNS